MSSFKIVNKMNCILSMLAQTFHIVVTILSWSSQNWYRQSLELIMAALSTSGNK